MKEIVFDDYMESRLDNLREALEMHVSELHGLHLDDRALLAIALDSCIDFYRRLPPCSNGVREQDMERQDIIDSGHGGMEGPLQDRPA